MRTRVNRGRILISLLVLFIMIFSVVPINVSANGGTPVPLGGSFSGWKMNKGEGVITGVGPYPIHGHPSEYDQASFPADSDTGWVNPPSIDYINYQQIPSTLCNVAECRQGLDFTYFKTTVYIPSGATTFTVTSGTVDDGLQLILNGVVRDYAYLGGYVSTDLLPYANKGAVNSLRIIHVDDCCYHSYLYSVRIFIDGTEIPKNNLPIADANGPYSGYEGQSITLDGSGSSDPDGDSLQYRWDFTNDGTWDTSYSGSPTVTHTYSNDFSGLVKLEVFDGEDTDTDTATVTIENRPPVAEANGPYYGYESDTITLDGSGSYDPAGDSMVFEWDLDNDGSYDDATGATPTYSWGADGTYPVKLRVYDGTDYDYSTTTAYISNRAPEIYSSTYVYTLKQGTFSTTIPAIETATSGASFYNYFSASSHTGYETPYESKLMLHRDITTDAVTLIVTHNIDFTTSGISTGSGSVFFNFDGIPTGAYVSQSDDPGHNWGSSPLGSQTHGSPYNEFDLSYDREGEWYYGDNTDGGSLSGLPTDSSWSITITPEGFYNINSWVYHYATGEDIDLDMDEPVTISYQAQTSPTTVETDEGTPLTIGAFARDWGTDDNPLDYEFYWNDPDIPTAASTGTTPWDTLFTGTHTYYDDGTRYPILTVEDSDGATDTLLYTAIVNNVAPVVEAGSYPTVDEGTPLTLSGTYTDPGAFDTHTASWCWGDGTPCGTISPSTSPATADHTYTDNGMYTAVLTVTDDDGGVGSDTALVQVLNVPPAITLADTYTAYEGDNIAGSGSFSDPGADSWTATVDYGDGTGVHSLVLNSDKTFDLNHVYGDNGIYTITVIVTDDDGGTDTDTSTAIVLNMGPTVSIDSIDQPVPYFILPGHVLTFHGSFTDPGWLDTHSAVWDFGDGTIIPGTLIEENMEPDSTGTIVDSHMYSAPGDYIVKLTVTDDDGDSATVQIHLQINDAEEAKHSIMDYINALPDYAFSHKEDLQKQTLMNKFDALDKQIQAGAYNGAINKLTNDILPKMDGVDDNWIIDTAAQADLVLMIEALVAYLETLM